MAQKKEEEFKVAADVAEADFERFIEENDLLIDEEKLDAKDLTQYQKQKSRLIREIMRGYLTIDENGQAVYTPHNPRSSYNKPIVFKERTGASIMAMDGKKQTEEMRKTYAIMAEMCGVHASTFAGLAGTDIKVCEAIFALLMD